MIQDKVVLITGGTGSIGKSLAAKCLSLGAKSVRILSRSEYNQHLMQKELHSDRLRFLVGDVADRDRVDLACRGVDIVFHAAGMKRVDTAEYNPDECIKTNIVGAQNVIRACHEARVDACIAVSTDKAVRPTTIMGSTKQIMERLFCAAPGFLGTCDTRFAVARFGNVIGSRGSVFEIWDDAIKTHGVVIVRDPGMTRYVMPLQSAVDLLLYAEDNAQWAECKTFVKHMLAADLESMARAMIAVHCTESAIVYGAKLASEKTHEALVDGEELAIVVGCAYATEDRGHLLSSEFAPRLSINDLVWWLREAGYGGEKNTHQMQAACCAAAQGIPARSYN